MSLLDKESKAFLVAHMRKALTESVKNNKSLSESAVVNGVKYVEESATYEQLLNLTMNPLQESKYLPDYVCEGASIILAEAMLTGRKVIGLNAITEGALNLQKKMPEATITEAMLECALAAAQTPALQMIGKVITESTMFLEEKKLDAFNLVTNGKMTKDQFNKLYTPKGYTGNNYFKDYGKDLLKTTAGSRARRAAKDFKQSVTKTAKQAHDEAKALGLTGKELTNYVNDHAGSMTHENAKKLKKLEDGAKRAGAQTAEFRRGKKAARGISNSNPQPVNLKQPKIGGKGIGKKAAIGAAAAAGVGAGAYAIKKWYDKKKQMRAAASQAK